jgi:competence protein ComEC
MKEARFLKMVRQPQTAGRMRVYFFNLLGDAILIELPSGKYVLIDGALGPRMSWVPTRLNRRLRKLGVDDTNLDAVILTHPHADHYAGLAAVVRKFAPKRFYHTGLESFTDWYKDFMRLVRRKGCEIKRLRRGGDPLMLDSDVEMEVLWPPADAKCSFSMHRTNCLSMVTRLRHGAVSFLFAGDIKRDSEHELIELCAKEAGCSPDDLRASDYGLGANILKAGHHGSRTSSSREFLAQVKPSTAVIVSGRTNIESGAILKASPDTVRRIEDTNATVLQTSQMGTVMIETDGYIVRRLATPLHLELLDDSDGDGIDDGAEIFFYGSDRWQKDTDGNGIDDWAEYGASAPGPDAGAVQEAP